MGGQPPAVFRGAINRGGRFPFYASGPFGTLWVDEDRIVISASPFLRRFLPTVDMERNHVRSVHLGPGWGGCQVSVIAHNGDECVTRFSTLSRDKVREALLDRGWRVTDDFSFWPTSP